MKIALGTAQFGFNYGITNSSGKISLKDGKKILDFAKKSGMNTIDTAMNYGNCEQQLGKLGVKNWFIISKLPPTPNNCENISSWISSKIDFSLNCLKVDHLGGLLLHRPDQLLKKNGRIIYDSLLNLKKKGKVSKIGISIYNPSDLNKINSQFKFDIVQVPFNIFDRRLLYTGWLERLKNDGVEIHVRSALLQGLLISSIKKTPFGFERWEFLWDSWRNWVNEKKLNPIEAALGHVLSYKDIDQVIVGVDNINQLSEIISLKNSDHLRAPDYISTSDVKLLDPFQWKKIGI